MPDRNPTDDSIEQEDSDRMNDEDKVTGKSDDDEDFEELEDLEDDDQGLEGE